MSEEIQAGVSTPVDTTDAIASLLSGGSEDSADVEETEMDTPESDDDVVEESEEDDGPDDDSADNEDDEPEEDDEEGDGPGSDIDNQEFTVNVNGEEVKVKGSELKSGYLRQSDYTRKTQEVAAERKKITSEMSKVVEQANVVSFTAHNKLAQFDNALAQVGGWDKLRVSYPPEQVEQFTQQYVAAQQEADVCNSITEEYKGQIKQNAIKEITGILTDLASTTHGFTGETFTQMDKYLVDNGFNQDMVTTITHPQAWEMIYKSMKYDEAQNHLKSDKAKAAESKVNKSHRSAPTKPVPAGTRQRKLSKAIERQRKTGGTGREGEQATQDALVALLSGK